MANNGPTIKTEPGAQENEAWDEERLELALNQLKLLHIKLRGLRTTIPRMMEPLSAKQPSRTLLTLAASWTATDMFLLAQATFNSFMDSVAAAKREVQDFQDLRKSDEITKIMDHAAQRRKEEPNGIKAWRTTDHPDWMTKTTTTTTTTTDS
ncbi:ribosomal protein l34e [Colletotrichum incanum]|uniref:Ribosomal protein l34e n=1 Tax=Colletotrichum incanum TaxID=1573173 RepID=A0A167EC32_COLIC|nr:ribosomal protein l34e [Colletotrichum incanum]